MRSELLTHFFFLPHTKPSAISRSITGNSAVAIQEEGCCEATWRRARTIAELLTVQPSASDASCRSCCRKRSVSRVSEWARITRGSFLGVGLRVAMKRVHNSFVAIRREQTECSEQSVTKKRAATSGISASWKDIG